MTAPGAYVHVPYCAHRCTYCSFVAIEGLKGEEAYFDALVREVETRSGEVGGPLATVYFGGGTPSYVAPARLGRVMGALAGAFGVAEGAEVTAEANPDDCAPALLEELLSRGVSRLSIGVQSLRDDELVPLERRHDAASAVRALRSARERFPEVSADLMIGIPGQTRETLLESLARVLETGVTHVSAYLLELEKSPRLLALRAARPELFASDDEMADRWEALDDALECRGFRRYELSNWAVPGSESRHNLKYWLREPVLGFGVAAHSFDGTSRRANTGSTAEYLRRVAEEGEAVVSVSAPSPGEAARERVLLGLRLADGVPEDELEAVSAGLGADERDRLAACVEAGLVERSGGRAFLTRRGVLLSNEVFQTLV